MSVSEFRVALTQRDFDQAIRFFKEGLGLDAGEKWDTEGEGKGQILWAGRAGLEIFDEDYTLGVDMIEAGEDTGARIRFAFEVEDVREVTKRAIKFGATLVNEPVMTPWGDLNVRLESPEGLQVTLCQRNLDH